MQAIRALAILSLLLAADAHAQLNRTEACSVARGESKKGKDADERTFEEEREYQKVKLAAADQCYHDNRGWNLLFGGLEFTADGGLSNGIFDSASINQRSVSELSETEFQYGFKIGYSERPIIRDFLLLTEIKSPEAYRDLKHDVYRWAFMDAVTMKAEVGWGTTIEPDDRKERFTTSEDLIFEVGLQYSLPLENLGFPLSEP